MGAPEQIEEQPQAMKAFVVSWPGENAGGIAFVIAETVDKAIELAWATDACSKFLSPKDFYLEEVDVTKERVAFTNRGNG